MRDAHRPGHPAAMVRARADVRRAPGRDEVRGVEMASVGRLPDEQRDVDPLGQPLVRGHVELAHRLLVPPVPRLRERPPEVDRIRQVERGRAVEHQVDVRNDVRADPLAEVCVGPRVPPGMQLERRIPASRH